MRDSSIASHFVRAAVRGAQQRGFDVTTLLREAGINAALLDEARARINPEHFTQLIQRLWEVLDDEYLGLCATTSKQGTFAMMCNAIIHCRTLDKALSRGALFYSLFPSGPQIHLQQEGAYLRLILDDRPLRDPEHFLTECLLLIWHRLGSWLIGQRIRLEEVSFSFPAPDHQAEYELLFPCPRRFSAHTTSLLLPSRYLEMPLLQDERTLKHFLKNSPADLLARPDAGNSLCSQIRRLLGRDCRHWPDLEQIAVQLHVSPQTLRRRLREEGPNFQELKDQLRRDLAIYYLGQGRLSIHSISDQLGFSEPSAFHRAFKKWTGLTPGAYRNGERQVME